MVIWNGLESWDGTGLATVPFRWSWLPIDQSVTGTDRNHVIMVVYCGCGEEGKVEEQGIEPLIAEDIFSWNVSQEDRRWMMNSAVFGPRPSANMMITSFPSKSSLWWVINAESHMVRPVTNWLWWIHSCLSPIEFHRQMAIDWSRFSVVCLRLLLGYYFTRISGCICIMHVELRCTRRGINRRRIRINYRYLYRWEPIVLSSLEWDLGSSSGGSRRLLVNGE